MHNLLRIISLILFLFLTALDFAFAAEKDALDWTVWRNLPVSDAGRLMPLDTFARQTIETICGRTHPTLALADTPLDEDPSPPEYAEAQKLFPQGAPHKFIPEELLLSWLVEPEKWQRVPFLKAEHEQLRQEVLNLPLLDGQGRRLRYVSPQQVENCPELGRHGPSCKSGQRPKAISSSPLAWTRA